MEINFKCKKCEEIFDCNVGEVVIDSKSMDAVFEFGIYCPQCGKVTMDDVVLTELGQTQMMDVTIST